MAFTAVQAILCSGSFVLGLSAAIAAEQIRFDTAEQWREWPLPMGIVQLDQAGIVRPVEIRKNVDPVRNAAAFGGGFARLDQMPSPPTGLSTETH